jgi:hypothetical protein
MNIQQKQNVYLAAVIGGLRVLAKAEPTRHTRKAVQCFNTADSILLEAALKIPNIQNEHIEDAKTALLAMEDVFDSICKTEGISYEHIALNLILFCMEELPLSPKQFRAMGRIFRCYHHADSYEAIRAGERVWTRLETEIEILTAQKRELAK